MKNALRTFLTAGNLVLALAVATPSFGGGVSDTNLAPLQAHTVNMSYHTAVVYYTILANGDYQVITTIGPNAEVNGLTSQHRVTIQSGQSYELSLDSGVAGTPANAIRFTANGDKLLVASR